MLLAVLLAVGTLAYVVANLAPQAFDAYRTRQTQEALAQAREALLGYALKYRDVEGSGVVYGYLPLPDLGSSRNNNVACTDEGCDAANFTGNAPNVTVIGRLPWRTLGTGPLRDSNGECLWYAVSGSHKRTQPVSPMNWDTLGQLDVVVANGSNAMASAIASAHDRPVAVIFSPGPPLGGQDRRAVGGDIVAACGGNYDAANYLDPGTAGLLAGVSNYFAGAANNAFANTGAANKSLSLQGVVQRRSDGTLWASTCPAGTTCDLAANDAGLALTGDMLFGALRKSSNFRADINTMLDRMTSCLRDRVTTGTLTPAAIAGYAPPADKNGGRIPIDSCYGDNQAPLNYFSHYQDQFFVATPTAGNFNVTTDGIAQSCPGVLLFANQRGSGQSRATIAEKATLANYLEGNNLQSFVTNGSIAFSGPSRFDTIASGQTTQQDIVRCIPAGTSFTTVDSPALATGGFSQLAAYDPGTRTLTLGAENVTTGQGAPGGALFGCAWMQEAHALNDGLRAYFQFRFIQLGTSVGDNGFVFAIADAETNGNNVCGASASHLGYSGYNGVTPLLTFPKLGIEFDQGRNADFSEGVANPGRNDPCGTSGCGGTVGYNSHVAIVYWGHDTANAIDGVTLTDYDDNVHGFPSTGSQTGGRPAPKNPDASPGIEFVNLRGQASEGGDSYLYHVRVEVTPSHDATGAAELRHTSVNSQVWIERDSGTNANLIAAMQNTTRPMAQLYPGYAARLRDSAVMYDVAITGSSCTADSDCLTSQACGTDHRCYRQALRTVRPGFTGSQRTQDQQVNIGNFFVSWSQ